MMDFSLKDFIPINNWAYDKNGPCWEESNEPQYITDLSTNKSYWNESFSMIRKKFILLIFASLFINAIAILLNIFCRILKIITFFSLWMPSNKTIEKRKRFSLLFGIFIGIFLAPFVYLSLFFSAIYGLFKPLDGRKLYASFERLQYSSFRLAPCFQPDPKYHLFGGDMNKKDSL
jgi:ABC-type uncharacterized transport system permease subunit